MFHERRSLSFVDAIFNCNIFGLTVISRHQSDCSIDDPGFPKLDLLTEHFILFSSMQPLLVARFPLPDCVTCVYISTVTLIQFAFDSERVIGDPLE